MMKVLLINGSPRRNGNTAIALEEMEKIFTQEGVEVETVQVGNQNIRGCIACLSCKQKGKCVFDDLVNEIAPKYAARKEELGQGGGYTRIYLLGERRGDGAEEAIIELV